MSTDETPPTGAGKVKDTEKGSKEKATEQDKPAEGNMDTEEKEDTRKVTLKSSDDVSFSVPVSVAKLSQLVNSMVEERNEDDDDDEAADKKDMEIPLPKVTSSVLEKVITFCTHYKEEPMEEIKGHLKTDQLSELVKQQWYLDFVKVDQIMVFDLILAANFMDIPPLLDLASANVASMMMCKTPEQIRETFNLENDFTKEEEEQVIAENKWTEET